MKTRLILFFILSLHSCSSIVNTGIEMNITNTSSDLITGVVFSTTEKVEVVFIDSIVPGESVITFLSMKDNKLDGAYFLSFTRSNGTMVSCERGYYSNGNPLDQWADIKVMDDTTLIDFKPIK